MNKICVRKSDILTLINKHQQGSSWVDFDKFIADLELLAVKVDSVNRVKQLTELIKYTENKIKYLEQPVFVHTKQEVAAVFNVSRRTLYVWESSKIIMIQREYSPKQLRLKMTCGYDVTKILDQLKKYAKHHKTKI